MTLYRDLVQFEPIIDIKVLTEANTVDQAREDVRTYVVSTPMRDALTKVLVPNLRFDNPGADHKGTLIVATYGTGKTHLMAMVSAVAEHAGLAGDVSDSDLAKAMAPIAGRFKVIRAEIGATRMSLRDIVCRRLEEGVKAAGVTYQFKPADQAPNTKDLVVEMMQAFETVHPDHGLLFVLDELLDYLRTRRDLELNLDLTFLREIGEVCRRTRFRFIAGIQESLFDNPRLANMAAEVLRVRERYDQLRISREDVSFVVQERLLKKTISQRDQIRDHLRKFTPAFVGMVEHLDDFVNLFPVHPVYLKTFQEITLVEKRKVLSTLSHAMTALLDLEVPRDQPGLICYDSYRQDLDADPASRLIPDVREVLDKVDVLRTRVEKALKTKGYIPTALRIIDGLAVHRLTTSDIHIPIGVTIAELRDDLCLLPEGMPELTPEFIQTTLGSVVDEIISAVSGQFITENSDNGQIYLDVLKDIDYDQKIEERAAPLDNDRLDEAYFTALEEVLELRDAPYVAGYRIWAYPLGWAAKNVDRAGYLFMGAPNERSTAQPPRDFYVYFLQPYDPPTFEDERKADEVFFSLGKPGDEFTAALRKYAGAHALTGESTETHRKVYEGKRNAARTAMVVWLKKNIATAITVTHAGVSKPLGAWLSGAGGGSSRSVKEQVDAIAAEALKDHFNSLYPGYPAFAVNVTQSNLAETVKQAIGQVVTGRPTAAGNKVLMSLELVDIGGNLIDSGPFGAALLKELAFGAGKAVNRSELLIERDRRVETWGPWHLEPEWLVVTAAVCCQLGRLEIGFPEGQLDATTLDRLARMTSDELAGLSHIAPPKPSPIVLLRDVAVLLELGKGAVPDSGADEALVRQVHTAGQTLLGRVAQARSTVTNGVSLWGALVVDQQTERDARLESLQRLLENVLARNSVGKLNKLNADSGSMSAARDGLDELKWVEAALASRERLTAGAEYLREAVSVFGSDSDLTEDAGRLRADMLALFAGPIQPAKVANLASEAERLRKRCADEAARAHARDRLDAEGDERKRQIIEGSEYKDLKTLTAIKILPDGVFGSLETRLVSIGSCKMFDEGKLSASVVCPECGYRPQRASGPTARARVDEIASKLVELRQTWERTLIDSLRTPEIAEQVELLAQDERGAVSGLLETDLFPTPMTDILVRGVNQALNRFVVRRISRDELWSAVFPADQTSTVAELHERFSGFLTRIQNGNDPDRVRIIPGEETTS